MATDNVAAYFDATGGHAFPDDRLEFTQKYIKPDGNDWSWERRDYQRAWLLDKSQRKVARKAAQVGVTTLATAEVVHRGVQDWKIGCFLPGAKSMRKFVQTQLNPMINANRALRRSVVLAGKDADFSEGDDDEYLRDKAADSMETMHIARGVFHLIPLGGGLECVKQLPMDITSLDEVAEAARLTDPELGMSLIDFIPDRLQASEHGHEREFSQPGVEGMDIDAVFQESDQKYWMLRCTSCGHRFNPETEWPRGLRYRVAGPQITLLSAEEMAERYSVDVPEGAWEQYCPNTKCERVVTYQELPAEWVALHPGRAVSGYQFSQLWGPRMTPSRLGDRWMRAQRSFSAKGAFVISVLGFPFSGDRKPLTAAVLGYGTHEYNPAPSTYPISLYYVGGVDCGKGLHFTIWGVGPDGIWRLAWAGHTEDEKEVAERMKAFGAIFAVDSMPERRMAKDMCLDVGSGAIVNIGGGGRQTTLGQEKRGRQMVPTIGVDRTELLDAVVDHLEDHSMILGKRTERLTEEVVAHLCMAIKDKQPDGKHLYRKDCENHWLMAAAMAKLVDENAAPMKLRHTTDMQSSITVGGPTRLTGAGDFGLIARPRGVTEMNRRRERERSRSLTSDY